MSDPSVQSAASTELSRFNDDLFAELDAVQAKIVDAQTSENEVRLSFLASERDLLTKGIEFTGPSPSFVAPSWLGGTDPIRKSYHDTFKPIVEEVLTDRTAAAGKQEIESDELLKRIKDEFQAEWKEKKISDISGEPAKLQEGEGGEGERNTTEGSLQPAAPIETRLVEWVAESALGLTQVMTTAKLEAMVHAIIPSILAPPGEMGLRQNWWTNAEFWTGDGTDDGKTDTWEGAFVPVIEKAAGLDNMEEAQVSETVDSILKELEESLQRQPTGPNEEVSDEQTIRAWVSITIQGLSVGAGGEVTVLQRDNLLSNLQNAVTSMFEQPDDTTFYTTFQKQLVNRVVGKPDQSRSTTTQSIKSYINEAVSVDNWKAIAGKSDYKNVLHGLTGDQLKALEASMATAASQLETRLVDIVTKAVSDTFLELSEQGVQGRMISTVHDHHMIKRISGYTISLLDRLNKHLFEDIPQNQLDSLAAAKGVTAAAIDFRNYAGELGSLAVEFKSESDTKNPPPSFADMKTLVGADGELLVQVADELYLEEDKPGPGGPEVKEAELAGVTLAAETASLGSDLSEVLKGDATAVKNSLTNLTENSKKLMTELQAKFSTASEAYFEALNKYAADRETFELEQTLDEALDESLASLTGIFSS